MPIRNSYPVRIVPTTLSDAIDGTNAPAGAMTALTNLVPDPATRGIFVPRPAAVEEIDFVAGGFLTPGEVTGLLVVGNRVAGMIPTARFAGHDEPFAYDLEAGAFVTVLGVTSANTPLSPPATGDWTPPVLAQVASRIIVTHPGFAGGAIKFG